MRKRKDSVGHFKDAKGSRHCCFNLNRGLILVGDGFSSTSIEKHDALSQTKRNSSRPATFEPKSGTCSFFLAISLFSQRKRPFVKWLDKMWWLGVTFLNLRANLEEYRLNIKVVYVSDCQWLLKSSSLHFQNWRTGSHGLVMRLVISTGDHGCLFGQSSIWHCGQFWRILRMRLLWACEVLVL